MMVLNMEWWWDCSLENVHLIGHYLFLQALNPVVKDHGKHGALMISPLPSSTIHNILSKETEIINKGNNSMYWIYGIIDSCRTCWLVYRDVPWFLKYMYQCILWFLVYEYF